MDNLTPESAAVHVVLYFGCASCEEYSDEGACYPRDMVRVTKDGELICDACFSDAPEWEYADKPDNWNDDEDIFRWSMLPEAPEYVPASRIATAEREARVRGLEIAAAVCDRVESESDDIGEWQQANGCSDCGVEIRALIIAAEQPQENANG